MSVRISSIELFRDLPAEALERLDLLAERRDFRAGVTLMRQGDPAEALFVIVHGRVRVQRTHPDVEGPMALAELGAGEVVGEMGVLDGEPRSASVVAIEDTEVLVLEGQALGLTLMRYPALAQALLKVFSRRLRSTDELLEQVLRRAKTPYRNGTEPFTSSNGSGQGS